MRFKLPFFLIWVFLLLVLSLNVAGKVVAITQMSDREPNVGATPPEMVLNSYAVTSPPLGVGVRVVLDPGASSVQYVNSSVYFYVMQGWVEDNWSSLTPTAQSAFLDPKQTNFTLETNVPHFQNPSSTHITNYDNATDSMSTWFWFQFFPGSAAPGTYSFTGVWAEAAAANPPNYTPIHSQNTITLVVVAKSAMSVSCSPNLVSISLPVTCTAIVTGNNPTGTITWTTSSSTGLFSSSHQTLSSGTCSTTYVDKGTGYVNITASYGGDANNRPSSNSTVLTVFANINAGTSVTVSPTTGLQLTFASVTTQGFVIANETPTALVPPLANLIGQYYDINVTATYSGNIAVSLAFNGSSMTQQQKSSLTLMQYTPIPGDINGPNGLPDGKVDMRDLAYIAKCFGSQPGSSRWDPKADINGDGKVDMKDIGLAAKNFGKISQWVNITTKVDTTNNVIYGQTNHFSLIAIG